MGAAEDRFEIMELLAMYAAIPDEKNYDGVFEVFTDPVRWDFASVGDGPATMKTPAEVKDWFLSGFSGLVATHHAITNHRIIIDGDHATIHAHVHAEHWIDPAATNGTQTCWLAVGFYDDEAVRTDAGWRLSSVKVTMTHETTLSTDAHSVGST